MLHTSTESAQDRELLMIVILLLLGMFYLSHFVFPIIRLTTYDVIRWYGYNGDLNWL